MKGHPGTNMMTPCEPLQINDWSCQHAEDAFKRVEDSFLHFSGNALIANDYLTAIGNALLLAPVDDIWTAPSPLNVIGLHDALSDLNTAMDVKSSTTLSFLLRKMAKKIKFGCREVNRMLKAARVAVVRREWESQLWESFMDFERETRLMYSAFLDDQYRFSYLSSADFPQEHQPYDTRTGTARDQTVRKPLSKSSLPLKSHTSFLDLPPEIRTQIYDTLAADTIPRTASPWEKHCMQTHWTPRPGITTDLLVVPMSQVNRQIRLEFLPRWHRLIELSFDCNENTENDNIDRWLKTFGPSRIPVTRSFSFSFGDDQVRIDLRGAFNNSKVQKEKVKVFSPPVKLTKMLKARSKRPENFEGNLQGFVEALLAVSDGTVRLRAKGVRAIMQYLGTLEVPKRQVCLCKKCVAA